MQTEYIEDSLADIFELLVYIVSIFSNKEKIDELTLYNPQELSDIGYLGLLVKSKMEDIQYDKNLKKNKNNEKFQESYQTINLLVQLLDAAFSSYQKNPEKMTYFIEQTNDMCQHIKPKTCEFHQDIIKDFKSSEWFNENVRYTYLWWNYFGFVNQKISECEKFNSVLSILKYTGNYTPASFTSQNPWKYTKYDVRDEDDFDYDYEPPGCCYGAGCIRCSTAVLHYLPEQFKNFNHSNKDGTWNKEKSREFFLRCLVIFDENKTEKRFEFRGDEFVFDYDYDCIENKGGKLYTKKPYFYISAGYGSYGWSSEKKKIGPLDLKTLEKYCDNKDQLMIKQMHKQMHRRLLNKCLTEIKQKTMACKNLVQK